MAKCAWANICPRARIGLLRSSWRALGRSSQAMRASRAANAASRPTWKAWNRLEGIVWDKGSEGKMNEQ